MCHFHTCLIWVLIKVQPMLSKQLLDISDNDPFAFLFQPAFIGCDGERAGAGMGNNNLART